MRGLQLQPCRAISVGPLAPLLLPFCGPAHTARIQLAVPAGTPRPCCPHHAAPRGSP